MKNVKQRKMMLVLPLLVIPFLTMGFWALGGGKAKKEVADSKGLNLDLPDANLKEEKLLDKLSFYDKADKDSMKLEEWMRSDPYFKRDSLPAYPDELSALTMTNADKYNQRLNISPYETKADNPEEKILQKLKLLEKEMSKSTATVIDDPVKGNNNNDAFSDEVNRLEQMLRSNNAGSGEDPEMEQLSSVMDKILDVQHPQRIKDRSIKYKEAAYAVRKDKGVDTLVMGFYSYSSEKELSEQNSIEAIIAANQTIVNGAVVKFRLLNDVYINGKLVANATIVSGIASLDGERLIVEINSVRSGKNLFTVKMEVYDMDGLAGIYIPGTINRDVAKESANNSLSLMDMTSIDPSLKAQATATGIGAVKNLLSKKVKLVKVQVKAGYKVLFKNKNQDQ